VVKGASMRIVLDGLPLLGDANIATYLRGLVLSLAAANRGHEYALFFRAFRKDIRHRIGQLKASPTFGRFEAIQTLIPDRVLEWVWTGRAVHLPFSERYFGWPDLFLSTIYVTPILKGIPIIMIAYDLIPFRFPAFYGGDQPLLQRRLNRSVERAAAIIAISDCTKRDFVQLLGADPERIHVIYPGVDPRFGPEPDEGHWLRVRSQYGLDRPYVLYVGSLGPHKNVIRLVRAFRQLKRRHGIPHQLVLCGKALWGPDVIAEARDLIEAKDCLVLDFIAGEDLPSLYRGADAFAFLSLYEGFGLPPLEAMACGVPMVVSDAGSLPEVVGEAALRVSPTDDDAIEAALYRLLSEPQWRQALRERGLKQAAGFNWAQTARQTLKLFEVVAR
jgi:glycosyltransferase involved in cell wall biosynthesis